MPKGITGSKMKHKKLIIAIGGGELRQKETLPIDKEIARLAQNRAGEKRANALFLPTASHDSLPYFNTFRKTYTSECGLKADVALLTKKDIPMEKIRDKFAAADVIYVGGGDTVYMLDTWKKTGVDILLKEAYERGVILAGLSAGAICWFQKMYSDSDILSGSGTGYAVYDGMGWVEGLISPHYEERKEDFDRLIAAKNAVAYAVENNAALVIEDGTVKGVLPASQGAAYLLQGTNGGIRKEIITPYSLLMR